MKTNFINYPKKIAMLSVLFYLLLLQVTNLHAQFPPPKFYYTTPNTYNVGTTISPLSPTVVARTVTNIDSGIFSIPTAVATDALGNVYLADYGHGGIKKIATNGAYSTLLSTGFIPGVASDASGNVYYTDAGANAVKKLPVGGGSVTTIATGFTRPYGIAIDVSGNIYVSDNGSSHTVKKIPAGSSTATSIGTFNSPYSVAVDGSGNVYVADSGSTTIKVIATSGSISTIGSGFINPYGVAVDAAGNVYVADNGHNLIKQIPAGNGTIVTLPSGSPGFSNPFGITIDAVGNIYVADYNHSAIKKISSAGSPGTYRISPSLPPGLSISSSTGVISGAPTYKSNATSYRVTDSNSVGKTDTTLQITVNCSATTATVTVTAYGSYTWHGTVYSTSTSTATFDSLNAAGCDSLTTLHLTVINPITWTGATSTDWNTAANWSPTGVPPINSSITILATPTNPPVLGSNVTINALTLGNSLAINGNTLTINGAITGAGSFTGSATSGLVINGTAGSTLYFNQSSVGSTNTLQTLTINTTGTVTLGNPLTIPGGTAAGIVTVNTGTLASNGNLVLASDSLGTARIAQSNGTNYVTGNVTVQRYITSKFARVFEFVGSAVGGVSVEDSWHRQIYITGSGGTSGSVCGSANDSGFDVTQTHAASMFNYTAGTVGSSHWASIPSTKHTYLTPGVGYDISIRGSKDNGATLGDTLNGCYNQLANGSPALPNSVTLVATGTAGQGDVTVPLSTGSVTGSLYTLVANPYPCPIDFKSVYDSNSTNLTGTYYLYGTVQSNGVYSQANYTTCVYDPTASPNPTLSCTNIPYGGPSGGYNNLNLIESGQAFLVKSATNTAPSFTFHESNKTMATPWNISFLGIPAKPNHIRVGLQTNTHSRLDEVIIRFDSKGSKTYNSKQDAESLNEGSQVLVTKKGASGLAIATRPATLLADTAQLGVASKTVGNFQLVFSQFDGMDTTKSILLRDKYLGVVQDVRNNPVYAFQITTDTGSRGNNRFDVVFGASGNAKVISEQITVSSKQLTVYPNPVSGKSFNLQLGNAANGKYSIRLLNSIGKTVYSSVLTHNAGTKQEKVIIGKQLAAGSYHVTATDAQGNVLTTQVMIK